MNRAKVPEPRSSGRPVTSRESHTRRGMRHPSDASPKSAGRAGTDAGGAVPEVRRAAYERAMKRLRTCIFGLIAVLLALLARTVIDGPDLPVALAITLIALVLLAAGRLWRYGVGIAETIDRDE